MLVEYQVTNDSNYRKDKSWKREPLEKLIGRMIECIEQGLRLKRAFR